ncbi:hypothetical protein AGMMS49965_19150 [Bacteroidia bacterium]|nr:hypothetical protein AGMMS49965_19150 [Bacteroidia bacterium]
MTDKEREELLQYMRDFNQRVKTDKELGKQFLIEAGILDHEGYYTEPYQHLGAAIQAAKEKELLMQA